MRWLLVVVALGCGADESRVERGQPRYQSPDHVSEPAAVGDDPAADDPAADDPDGDDRAAALNVRWRIEAEPLVVTPTNRDSFRLRLIATNEGDENVDPQIDAGRWTLDGEDDPSLSMGFGNGIRVMQWFDLPPGETVTDERGMGHLLTEPGEHIFAYHHGDQSATVRVRVE